EEAVARALRQVDLDLHHADGRDSLDAPVDRGVGVLGPSGRELSLGHDLALAVLDRERGAAVDLAERPRAGTLDALLADVVVRDHDPEPRSAHVPVAARAGR